MNSKAQIITKPLNGCQSDEAVRKEMHDRSFMQRFRCSNVLMAIPSSDMATAIDPLRLAIRNAATSIHQLHLNENAQITILHLMFLHVDPINSISIFPIYRLL